MKYSLCAILSKWTVVNSVVNIFFLKVLEKVVSLTLVKLYRKALFFFFKSKKLAVFPNDMPSKLQHIGNFKNCNIDF